MATNRISWNQTGNNSTLLKLRQVISNVQGGRGILDELKRVLDKYNADFTSMGTDLGLSATDAQTVYNLVVQAWGELCSTASTQVNVGAATGTRQIIDALG